MQLTPEEIEASEEQLRRAVLTLWQTNLLRRTKLTVLDEVANGLSFYDYTFLREVPRLHCALEDRLERGRRRRARASWRRSCGWEAGSAAIATAIPFVTAEVMRGTLRLQSARVLRFYLDELHALGSELSLAAHLADVSDELRALAERSPDTSPHRAASRIGSRCPASMRGSPRPRCGSRSTTIRAAGRRSRALCRACRSSRPISTCSTAR